MRGHAEWHFPHFRRVGAVASLPLTFLTDYNCGSRQGTEEVCMCDCVTVSVCVCGCVPVYECSDCEYV